MCDGQRRRTKPIGWASANARLSVPSPSLVLRTDSGTVGSGGLGAARLSRPGRDGPVGAKGLGMQVASAFLLIKQAYLEGRIGTSEQL